MELTSIKTQLWQRRQEIATLWQTSLAEFDHTYPLPLNQFTKLVEDFIIVLFQTPLVGEEAYALGADFVQTHHVHPEVLTRTQTILLQELPSELCPEDLKAVQSRLIQTYNHFFAGYSEFAYMRLIESQAKEIKGLSTRHEKVTLFSINQHDAWLSLVEQVSNPIIFHDGTHILGVNPAIYTLPISLPQTLKEVPVLNLFVPWAQKSLKSILQSTILTAYETAVLIPEDIPLSISFQNISL